MKSLVLETQPHLYTYPQESSGWVKRALQMREIVGWWTDDDSMDGVRRLKNNGARCVLDYVRRVLNGCGPDSRVESWTVYNRFWMKWSGGWKSRGSVCRTKYREWLPSSEWRLSTSTMNGEWPFVCCWYINSNVNGFCASHLRQHRHLLDGVCHVNYVVSGLFVHLFLCSLQQPCSLFLCGRSSAAVYYQHLSEYQLSPNVKIDHQGNF